MNLKEIKCPFCGISISIPNNTTKCICDHCNQEFVINNNEVELKQEQTNSSETIEDTLIQDANDALNQSKDYEKSLNLYKELLQKYTNRREIYIGLIRSITKDFTINNINGYELNQINEYFKKYKILATDEEIELYDTTIRELNKSYWYNTLINKTNDFNPQVINEEINTIEECYNNYINYCKKNENVIKEKYEQYIIEYKNIIDKKNKKKSTIIKISISILVILLLITLFFIIK